MSAPTPAAPADRPARAGAGEAGGEAGSEGGRRSPWRVFLGWPRWGRWTAYVALAVVLVLLAVVVAGVVVARRPLPTVAGEVAVPGLEGQVRVLRDSHGVPQVYADTSEDLFFAQGYVQAQDRFFEMDVRRHVTAGRVSELVGEAGLPADTLIRTMGWRRVAERELSLLDPDTVAYLESFSSGVNAYLDQHTPSEIAVEYSVLAATGLDYAPEDWTPADSVAWLKAMAWDLRSDVQDEIERSLMLGSVGPDAVDELYPPYPYDRHRPIVDQGALVDGVYEAEASGPATRRPARPPLGRAVRRALAQVRDRVTSVPELMGRGEGLGSNSWVVSGERSTTGEPLLANDPHLGVSVPGVWYPMGLHCRQVTAGCPFDVSGFTFAGLPGVVIGHNEEIAWGFTNLGADVSDLYLERIEGRDYTYDGEQVPLRSREETIEVRGRERPYRFSVRSTRHGPLLSDVSPELSTVGANAPGGSDAPDRDNGYAVSLAWTALEPSTTADAIFALDAAGGWEEFRAAAEDLAVPAQNLVYADRAGHIGYQAPGRVPIRRSGVAPDLPGRGWDPAEDWTGDYVAFDALPSVLDPEDGYVVTANQAVVGEDYPYYLGDSWSPGYRSDRIEELLLRQARLGPQDMARIQLDERNGFAPTFVPYLQDILLPSDYLGAGQRLLEGWNYQQHAGSAAAAYYNDVWDQTLRLTFADELSPRTWPDGGGRWFEVMRRLLADPTNPWWDDVTTETIVESRDDILQSALAEARDDLVRRQSRRAVDWTWGHHHRLDLEHQTLGQSDVAAVRWLLNRGGWPVGGGGETVDATGWDAAEDSFRVTTAPSMRMVVDLADLDASRWVNLTGVSGHPASDHYVDQTDLIVAGETLAWPFSRRAVRDAAEDTLTLVPGEGASAAAGPRGSPRR